MVSSGGRLVAGAGDGVRATVASTGSWSRCIDASTLSFEYSWDMRRGKEHARAADDQDDERGRDAGVPTGAVRAASEACPVTAHATSSATVSVWTAATSDPTRELTTPVARNSWNVSAGIRN